MGLLLRIPLVVVSKLDNFHFVWLHECCWDIGSHIESVYSVGSKVEIYDVDVGHVVCGSWSHLLPERDEGDFNTAEN